MRPGSIPGRKYAKLSDYQKLQMLRKVDRQYKEAAFEILLQMPEYRELSILMFNLEKAKQEITIQ
jgi:hypothetical protein